MPNTKNGSDAGDPTGRPRVGETPGWPAIAAATAVLFLMLVLPNHPDALTPGALAVLPLELLLIAALLLLSPHLHRWGPILRVAAVVFLGGAAGLKLADFGLFTALNRPFSLAYDLPLVHAAWMLLSGTSGVALAAAYVGAAVLAVVGLIALTWWATGVLAAAGAHGRRPAVLAAAMLTGIAGLAAAGGVGTGSTARLAYGHAEAVLQAARDIATMEAEAADDPVASVPVLSALDGRDVILAFVESYGRSTHDNPLYAVTTRAALQDIEADLRQRGLAMRSAWLTSPVVGGMSWLAHATLLSGLWIDSQGRYNALLRSERHTLVSLAAAAGWRTVAVMPAITMPWPEGSWFRHSRIYAAADLGYRGQPFNWVTMPDQYTWSAFERLELAPKERPPVFAEIALISSHAPWTPIPTLVRWEDVGDGTVFDAQAASGDSPETVWRDTDRIRDQFRQSIDYALRTMGSFAARHAERAPLLIVLGDHQPAVFVSGSDTLRDVPIHVIGDPAVLARLDAWGFADGLLPSAEAPVWRMDRFRDRFLDAFSVSRDAPEPSHEPS